MPTILELGLLADSVYESDPKVAGWTRIAFQPSRAGLANAFQGAAFKKGNEVVFAFKGTSGARDVVADVKLGLGMNTAQYGDAGQFVKHTNTAGGEKIYLTGHSLGGAMAQVIGNRQKLPFCTFNAPGVGLASRNVDEMAVAFFTGSAAARTLGSIGSIVRHPKQAVQDIAAFGRTVRGVNFRHGKDAVGCIGVHFGKVIELPFDRNYFHLVTKHSMGAMLKAIEKSSYANMELEDLL